jgi:hypothetical protein
VAARELLFVSFAPRGAHGKNNAAVPSRQHKYTRLRGKRRIERQEILSAAG